MNETTTGDAVIVPEPLDLAELYADVNEVPMLGPYYPALDQVYDGVPEDVIAFCEKARTDLHDVYLYALQEVHKALAPYGRFKAWCAAVGLNYGSIENRLSRANSKQEVHSELTGRLPEGATAETLVAYDTQAKPTARARPHNHTRQYRDASLKKLVFEFLLDDHERGTLRSAWAVGRRGHVRSPSSFDTHNRQRLCLTVKGILRSKYHLDVTQVSHHLVPSVPHSRAGICMHPTPTISASTVSVMHRTRTVRLAAVERVHEQP